MKLPRDLSGRELAKALKRFGYEIIRQTSSHMRLKTDLEGTHSITIPHHSPLKIGTLNSILKEIAEHLGMSKYELLSELFGR